MQKKKGLSFFNEKNINLHKITLRYFCQEVKHFNYGEVVSKITKDLEEKKKLQTLQNGYLKKLWIVYEQEQMANELSQKCIDYQNNVFLTETSPTKEILSTFIYSQKKLGYLPKVVANSLKEISKVHGTRGHMGYSGSDQNRKQLRENEQFQKLLEAVEFGQLNGIEYDFRDTTDMLKSLTKLRFKSYKLQLRFMKKLHAIFHYKDLYDREVYHFGKDFPQKNERGAKFSGEQPRGFMSHQRFRKRNFRFKTRS